MSMCACVYDNGLFLDHSQECASSLRLPSPLDNAGRQILLPKKQYNVSHLNGLYIVPILCKGMQDCKKV